MHRRSADGDTAKEYGVMQVFTWEGTLQIPLVEVKALHQGA
jgi:hypothetical protein